MATAKIVLVTGGSRGLGKDMAISIARKGMDVLLTYRSNEEEAKETVKEIEALGRKAAVLQLDLSKPGVAGAFVPQVLEALSSNWNTQSLHGLVNNAGMGATVPFAQVTEDL